MKTYGQELTGKIVLQVVGNNLQNYFTGKIVLRAKLFYRPFANNLQNCFTGKIVLQ